MSADYYILESDGTIKPVDLMEWAVWFENFPERRRVDRTELDGGVWVSTVFLGLDHGFGEGSDPVLFETMVFAGRAENYMERYTTIEEARAGHKRIVEGIKSGTLQRD